jgi:hypothetical protein
VPLVAVLHAASSSAPSTKVCKVCRIMRSACPIRPG